MIQESFNGYLLKAEPVKERNGRWSVAVIVQKEVNGVRKSKRYFADDRISYILIEEAEKESINLGRNLVKANRIGF